MSTSVFYILLVVGVVVLMGLALGSVRVVPQARAGNIQRRLGGFNRTVQPGVRFIVPFLERLESMIDLREQVLSIPWCRVITEDNLVININMVVFFRVTEPRAASNQIAEYVQSLLKFGPEILRSLMWSMNLEQAVTSRERINNMLRGVFDEASGKWGIEVTRMKINGLDPTERQGPDAQPASSADR